MEREIEFRGKTTKGEWVYGDIQQAENINVFSYKNLKDKFCGITTRTWIQGGRIFHNGVHLVLKETIGQYVGLKDKHGNKIYEGDIVKILYTDWASKSENDNRTLEEYLDSLTRIGIVYWNNLSLCYTLKMKNGCFSSIHCGKYGYIEVIGNVHDNKDLLE